MTITPIEKPAAPARPAIDSWAAILSEVVELARGISATEFVPAGLRTVEKTTAAILYGRELGLAPMTALSSVVIVNGRPSLYAATQRALILAAGHDFVILEQTAEKAVVRARRAEQRTDEEAWLKTVFSRTDAERAGLWGSSDAWRKYPAEMLLNRVTSRVAKALFADVLAGLETAETLMDEEVPAPAPVTVRPRASRTRAAKTVPDAAAAAIESAPAVEVHPEPEKKPRAARKTDATAGKADSAVSRAKQQVLLMHCRRLGMQFHNWRVEKISTIIGRQIDTTNDLTDAEADEVIKVLAGCGDAEALGRRIAEISDARLGVVIEDPTTDGEA